MTTIEQKQKEFLAFILLRQDAYKKKEAGKPKPWTADPILQQYKFCNVYREQDPGTIWIARHWRDPYKDDPDMWFAMAVARWINWTGTLAEIDYPVPFNGTKILEVLRDRKARGEKVWTGAYMIGTQGNAVDKSLFIVDKVLAPLWGYRDRIRPKAGDMLICFATEIMAVKNQGRFMAGQIVCDTKYANPHLLAAKDWSSWCASGPGSRRGINRILGLPLKSRWKEEDFRGQVSVLQSFVSREGKDRKDNLLSNIHAQDIQNCLCEFDKYERVRLGQGFPRSKYPGAGE